VDVINGNAAEATAFLASEHKKWAERIKASARSSIEERT
jgi:hypothetical protein